MAKVYSLFKPYSRAAGSGVSGIEGSDLEPTYNALMRQAKDVPATSTTSTPSASTTEEEKNAAQRKRNTAMASGRPATLFNQSETSNVKVKKPVLGSGS